MTDAVEPIIPAPAATAPDAATPTHHFLHNALAELGKLVHFTYEEIEALAAKIESEFRG